MKKHANLAFFVPHNGCPQQCLFCNQTRISGASHTPTPAEVAAQCDKYLPQTGATTEIAFFGGSFTAIDCAVQRGLLEVAYPFVQAGRAAGIRISTRPDAIDADTLDCLVSYGVTAIELGAQSMDDAVLLANRRGHTAADVEAASALIRSRGFELGVQMMLGLYGERAPKVSARYTAQRLIELRPDTVRIYPTVVVDNTPLCDLYRAGEYMPLTVEQAAASTAELLELFEAASVRVIRTGLHADESLRASVVAGPFHPAFGEIAHSFLFRRKLQSLLAPGETALDVAVNPSDVSRAVGHRRMNVDWFAQQGVRLAIRYDPDTTAGEPRRNDTV